MVKTELDRMQALSVIVPVEQPTEWVSSMTVVRNKDKVRIFLDPARLNAAIMRQHTHLPTIEELLAKIKNGKVFSHLDLKDGYWQIPLTEESSYLTTFNMPFGRFRYTRLPFGLVSAGDVFQLQMTRTFKGIDGVLVLHDDILIHTETDVDHERVLRKV